MDYRLSNNVYFYAVIGLRGTNVGNYLDAFLLNGHGNIV